MLLLLLFLLFICRTRAVQKVVETLKTREQCSMVVSALKPGIIGLMKNMNGNHVAQRFLQYLKPEFNEVTNMFGEKNVTYFLQLYA